MSDGGPWEGWGAATAKSGQPGPRGSCYVKGTAFVLARLQQV